LCTNREGNLLEIAVEAARNRTTLGEISDALEAVLNDKHKPTFSGSKEIKRRSFEAKN
jgi:methylmalonyl-CoA mutase